MILASCSYAEDVDHRTMMQKLKQRFVDADNHMKGKESSVNEDPHPELSYITPGLESEKKGLSSSPQEGKQHGGMPGSCTVSRHSISHLPIFRFGILYTACLNMCWEISPNIKADCATICLLISRVSLTFHFEAVLQ